MFGELCGRRLRSGRSQSTEKLWLPGRKESFNSKATRRRFITAEEEEGIRPQVGLF